MANVSLKHIYKVYPNGAKAVNDFNMQIEDKEFIVFVGPSGCGKSTTLRMIAGLEEISAGELKIGDVVVNGMEPKDRDIAMVFQNYALYPHMTIYENIAFGLRMRKVPDVKRDKEGNPVPDKNGNEIPVMRKYNREELDRKVNEAAEILGITEYLKRKPKEMSGGQRQRVALGRAIVRQPKVMLLDEPLSNLDAKLRTQMRSEIVKLHNKLNTTFIYVTHDQVEAMTMGTRIVVMKDGYIQQIDTPKNLYMHPANKFVAGFIGTPQMNFFEGTLKKEGDIVRAEFAKSGAALRVPCALLQKVSPRYLGGDLPVCIGLRAEDISLEPEAVKNSGTTIKVRVSHLEELGTETLVYGDINLGYDGIGESDTKIIIKAAGFKDYKTGEIVEAALNFGAAHLFDCQTEESIMPQIPEYNYLDCSAENGTITFAGNKIKLPPAMECADGQGEMLIPVDAINFGGDIEAVAESCEDVNGKKLVLLNVNGNRLYALGDEKRTGSVKIGLDYKKLIVKTGGGQTDPMPLVNGLDGRFVSEKITENIDGKTKKVTRYYLEINGVKLEAPEAVYQKMFAATTGRKVYNSVYRYEWSPYDVALSDSGVEAQVVKVLDYGGEKFAQCSAGGATLYVKCEGAPQGTVHIAPDPSKVSVIERERNIKIV